MTIEFPSYPVCTADVIAAVQRQLESADWTRLEGAPEFEQQWEAYLGSGHAWFVSSGTAALEAIFLGHGIGAGDEIITTPYTWGASVSAILAIGAVPVFADIDYATGQIDPDSVRSKISARTKAILAVHLFGIPSPMLELQKIASSNGLLLFEDGSQAHGARLEGKHVGSFSDGAAFSCMGLKPLGATEGGIAVFRTEEAREKAYLYGRHPRGIDPERVAHLDGAGLLDTLQLGWRPSAISAAILSARLPRLDAENRGRRDNARKLRELLDGLPEISIISEPAGSEPVYHLLSFTCNPEMGAPGRDETIRKLREEGLPPFAYIPKPVHRMKRLNPAGYEGPPVLWHPWLKAAGVDYRDTRCPSAEKRCECALELVWNFTRYEPQTMQSIAAAMKRAFQK